MEPSVREQITTEEKCLRTGPVYSAICVLMLLHLGIVLSTSVNVPYWDDYDVFLRFLTEWRDSSSFSERLSLLTKQHNEHRLPAPRLTVLAFSSLFGAIDFAKLIVLSHCALLCSLVILAKEALRKNSAYCLIPCMLLMVLPVQEESTIWLTGVLSNHLVLAYAILAFALSASPSTQNGILACVVALAGVGSQANGLFILPVCAFIAHVTRKGKIRSVSYLLGAACVWSLYFTHYSKVPNHCSPSHALQHPLDAIRYGLNFLGTSISLRYEGISLLAGSFVVTMFFIGCLKKQYSTNPILFSLFSFLLITASANTAGRLCFGANYPLDTDGRYAIYSLTALSCSVLTLATMLGTRATPLIKGLTFSLLLLFGAAAFKYLPHLTDFSDRLEIGALRAHLTDDGIGMMYPAPDSAWKYFKGATERGLYRPSVGERFWRSAKFTDEQLPIKTQKTCAMDPIVMGEEGTLITGWMKRRGLFDQLLIRVKGADGKHIIFPEPVMRIDAVTARALPRHLPAGFAALIPEDLLLPTATLELILKKRDGSYEVCRQNMLYPGKTTVQAEIPRG